MSNAGWGKPKYGNSGPLWKRFKIAEGANVYRLLPPMKSLAEAGKWGLYLGSHFGYKGVDGKDPSKSSHRTFRCIENKNMRTGMVTQECPECNLIAENQQVLETVVNNLKSKGASEEVIELQTAPVRGWLKMHNVDRKWHINAMNEAGEFGVLLISHRFKKMLDEQIKELNAEGVSDPMSLEEGVWFDFHRLGKGISATDTVAPVYTTTVEGGRRMKTLKVTALTDAEANQALEVCPDLSTVVREITLEQINMLIESSGEPDEIDKILGISAAHESSAPAKAEPKPVAAKPVPVESAPEAPKTATDEPSEEEVLMAKLAELKAKKAATAAPVASKPVSVAARPATVTPKPASGPDPLAVSDEAFAKLFETS